MAFKIIFTRPGHERILIHFLNCAIKSSTPIKKVTLLDREITPEQVGTKGGRIDVLAETERGEKIDVEVQVGREEFMVKRSLYYWSRNYTNKFKEGDPYEDLKRTVCINILNYNLFDDDEFWGVGKLYDTRRGKNMTEDLEIQFIELNKMKHFDKKSPITFWMEFFKNPYSEASQQLYELVPEIDEAKAVFDRAIADDETRKMILFREDAKRNYNSAIAGAVKKGEKLGMAKGEKLGIEKGAQQAKIETAMNLLKMGLSDEQIVTATGLTIENVRALQKK